MKTTMLAAAVMAAGLALPAHAEGNWDFYVGVHNVNPKSDNGSLAGGTLDLDVGSDTRPTFGFGYWFGDALRLDVLAALPFNHDISLNGAHAGDFKHLPPTVTLQYHFNAGGDVRPFVGVGVNYTRVFDEDEAGPIDGTKLSLDNSFGLSAQAGLAVALNDRWSVAGDVRWFDIDSDVSVNGDGVGTANVDPIAIGLFAIRRF